MSSNIPPFYYPTSSNDEAHAAYAAWSNHYAHYPYTHPIYQATPPPPTSIYQYHRASGYGYPPYAFGYGPADGGYVAPPPPPLHHPEAVKEGNKKEKKKEKKKKEDSSDSSSDDDDAAWSTAATGGLHTPVDPNGWPIYSAEKKKEDKNESKKKKKTKRTKVEDDDSDTEYIGHYIPPGAMPTQLDGKRVDGTLPLLPPQHRNC